MDPDRKRQILNAEQRFTLRERLSRALAEKGIYVVGRLTHDFLQNPGSTPTAEDQGSDAPPPMRASGAPQAGTDRTDRLKR